MTGTVGTLRGAARAAAVGLIVLASAASAHAAGWKIAALPSSLASVPVPASLNAVSCPTAAICFAVGSTGSGAHTEPLVEGSNGASWSVQTAPQVPGLRLTGVSCPVASFCMAVGYYKSPDGIHPIAEVWNGTMWSAIPGNVGPGLFGAPAAVSCSSAMACMVVGIGLVTTAGTTATAAELWNGTTFSNEAVPAPSTNGVADPVDLTTVSCPPDDSCGAVGEYYAGGSEEFAAAHWSGTAWSTATGPSPGTKSFPELDAVSCTSASACVASGDGAEAWNGSGWSQQSFSSVDQNGLSALTCSAATACVGIGSIYNNDSTSTGLFTDTFDGTAWTPQSILSGLGAAAQPSVNGLSCMATRCTAVGATVDADGSSVPLVIAENGATWTQQTTPAFTAPDAKSTLTAVSCSDPGVCTAAGTDADGVLELRLTGGTWSAQPSPDPGAPIGPAVTNPTPASIACPTASSCVMFGNFTNGGMNSAAFSERWNGTGWSLLKSPGEGSDNATMIDAVACTSAKHCLAAGSIGIGVGEPMSSVTNTHTEQWTGLNWTTQRRQAASPAQSEGNDPDNELTGLSCSSDHACTAVGFADQDVNCAHCGNLAARYNGHTWSLQRPSQQGSIQSVSCPAATLCIAVGGGSAQVWNGQSWTRDNLTGTLNAVSCATKRSCVAVGTDRGKVFVERWNGARWSIQATPDPGGASRVAVTGVSCPRAYACVLVGSDRQNGQTVALAETDS